MLCSKYCQIYRVNTPVQRLLSPYNLIKLPYYFVSLKTGGETLNRFSQLTILLSLEGAFWKEQQQNPHTLTGHSQPIDQNRNGILSAWGRLLSNLFNEVPICQNKTFLQDYTRSDKAWSTCKFSNLGSKLEKLLIIHD